MPVYHVYAVQGQGRPEEGIIPLELELDDVSHHLDAGTQTNPSLPKQQDV